MASCHVASKCTKIVLFFSLHFGEGAASTPLQVGASWGRADTHRHTHFPHSVSADSCRLVPLMFGALSDTWSHFPETACETEESTAACMSEPVSTVSTCRLSAVWFGMKRRKRDAE